MELCLSVVITARMPVQHVHACACELEHTSVHKCSGTHTWYRWHIKRWCLCQGMHLHLVLMSVPKQKTAIKKTHVMDTVCHQLSSLHVSRTMGQFKQSAYEQCWAKSQVISTQCHSENTLAVEGRMTCDHIQCLPLVCAPKAAG